MTSPLVTVITATYNLVSSNRSEAFRRAADSVLSQTYSNIEYIIIDGASTDGTLDLFKDYEKSRKVTVYSEPDTGIYNAMNKGLNKASGKYIIYLNSDDFWHNPQGLEQSIHILELSGADFSIAPHTLQKADGKTAGICVPCLAAFFANMPFCHQTMLARTELLRETGGFDESFRIAADYDLVTRLFLRGAHPIYTPCNFATFCEGGISTQKDITQLQEEERQRVFHKNYDTIIGPEKAAKLFKGETDIELLSALSYLVHPSVAQQLHHVVHTHNAGRYLVTSGGAVRKNSTTTTTKINTLFNIPLLTIERTSTRTLYKLLGCIPLLSTDIRPLAYSSNERTRYFCGIPILRSIYTEQTSRKLLFGCITIYKKRII